MSAKSTAKTPTIAIARALKALGLKQGSGKDFKVEGRYDGKERTATDVLVLSRHADEVIAEHAEAIEQATQADGGWVFTVSVHYGHSEQDPQRPKTLVSNKGTRVREEPPAPVAEPVAEERPEPLEEPTAAELEAMPKAYMPGALFAYLVEMEAMVSTAPADLAGRQALERAEMQKWTGGSSAWIKAWPEVLHHIACYLDELVILMQDGLRSASEVGVRHQVVQKTAQRFADAAADAA